MKILIGYDGSPHADNAIDDLPWAGMPSKADARAMLGSVSLRLVREASGAVRVARLSQHNDPLRLMVAIDGSPQSEAAVSQVCRRTWHAGTAVRILAVHEVMLPANTERIAI